MRRSQSGPALRAAAAASLNLSRTLDAPGRQLFDAQPSPKPTTAPAQLDNVSVGASEEEEEAALEQQLDDEDIEHMDDMEAKLEAELEAALAELASSLKEGNLGQLDDDTKSRVAQLAPRIRQQQATQPKPKTQQRPPRPVIRGQRR
mmetsp:Transcript_27065/g.43328  ORF Transcript_27065/g.43328 Transcript_27065/m.43328 type:complete len:147 (+) Transcript_27065:116-556(+)